MSRQLSLPPDLVIRLLDEVADGICFVDTERRVTYWNRAAERLTGVPAWSILGHCCGEGRLVHCDGKGKVCCRSGCPLSAVMHGSEMESQELFVRCTDGSRRPVVVTATPVRDEQGNIIGAVEIFRDNRAKRDAEQEKERAIRLATIDPLTGLGNRRKLELVLGAYLKEGFMAESPGVLLLLDVDHFKQVNDTYGHDAGDMVLRIVARTIEACVRNVDTVARWGGEEFVIFLPGARRGSGEDIAQRLRWQVAKTVTRVDHRTLEVSCSIGGAEVAPEDTVPELIRRADQQMYRAKHSGRNRVCFAAEPGATARELHAALAG
jgi:diguanylate cyclase (GGDEF)-like protein/PAS domain S-box-containing protein